MTDNIPNDNLAEIYVINKLNCNTNDDFPLSMALLKVTQDKDEKLEDTLKKSAFKNQISTIQLTKNCSTYKPPIQSH